MNDRLNQNKTNFAYRNPVPYSLTFLADRSGIWAGFLYIYGGMMAQRRMFSMKVVDTDKFLEMPTSARLLYYDLAMRADDDGFVNSPKKIIQMIGASTDDFKILCAKDYIIPFESGVIVIKDWKIHNLIRHDRYTETEYREEKTSLNLIDNKYVIPNGNQMAPQVRLGKVRLGKDSIKKDIFTIPTIEQITEYCKERNNSVDPNKFFDFYESKGWMVGKNKMKDYRAAIRTWETNNKKQTESLYKTYD